MSFLNAECLQLMELKRPEKQVLKQIIEKKLYASPLLSYESPSRPNVSCKCSRYISRHISQNNLAFVWGGGWIRGSTTPLLRYVPVTYRYVKYHKK